MSILSAILPAYNESANIESVLAVLRAVPEVNEIIVVDDGSRDATLACARRAAAQDARVQVLQHDLNRGKAAAMFSGAQAAAGEFLVFLDTDLHGLQPGHVQDLIAPVLAGRADMTRGIFRGGKLPTDFSHWATPWLSGQRCLPTRLFRRVPPSLAAAGYGIEVALTLLGHRWGWRMQTVIWRGVWHPPSEIHRGLWRGIPHRARMYWQIVQTWWALRRLKD